MCSTSKAAIWRWASCGGQQLAKPKMDNLGSEDWEEFSKRLCLVTLGYTSDRNLEN